MASPAASRARIPIARFAQPSPAPRQLYIDNIRSTMIILVVSMHAAVTYSGVGRWYYMEKPSLGIGGLFVLVSWQAWLQSFFMGLLFFIAGYFTPPAFDRKGALRFIKDRGYRLGLPTLLYMFAVGPITEYFVAGLWTSSMPTSFAAQWWRHLRDGEFLSGTGPMWFCAALLLFCVAYLIVRAIVPRPSRDPRNRVPGNRGLIAFMIAMGLATFLVRIVEPSGSAVLNMQLADFPGYVLLFIAGLFAYRGDWLRAFPYRLGIRWLAGAIVLGFVLWVAILAAGGAFHGAIEPYGGGWHWQSAAKSLWEAFVCVGISAGVVVVCREHLNRQGHLARVLSDNAFAVYLFHPPIVIAIARAMHGVAIDSLLKFVIVWISAVIVTYALCAIVFRRVPILRAIL